MDIKYFVRTTGERKLSPSFSQIEYELLIDKDHKPNESFFNQLEYISQWDAVLLEDDVELCQGFKEKIEKVINEHPNDIINFFTMPFDFFTSHYQPNFVYNQCTYYPKDKITKQLTEEMRALSKKFLSFGYDVIEGKVFKNHKIKVYVFRPCLVQHLDGVSIIGSLKNKQNKTVCGCRWSKYYENYLLNLGIKYEDAYERQDELEEELKRHKKTWWG